jgi:hypothetical protein
LYSDNIVAPETIMPTLSELFRNLHRLRRHARDLQAEIERGPLQLKARQNFATKQAAALQAAKDALKKKQVQVLDLESTLKSTHETIQKYTRQLSEVSDPKAYEALQHEIATAKAKGAELEDAILNGMTEVDEMKAALPGHEEASKKAAADLAAFDTDNKAKLARLAEEMKRTQAELKTAELELPNEVRPEYVRRVASYGADALAAVENGCCAYCRTGASQQQILNLDRGHFITCTACYRGLYLPE